MSNKLALFALGAAAAAAFVYTSAGKGASGTPQTADQKVSGPPTTKRLSYRVLKPGEETSYFHLGPALMLIDGKPVSNDVEQRQALAREVQAVWKLRQTTLPKDANRLNTDPYSKELYWVPLWLTYPPEKITASEMLSGGTGMPVDEFGRSKPGHYGNGPKTIWGQTLGGLLKNPLFKSAVVAAAVASGPEGVAIYGAYTLYENRGKELTPSNVFLIAGRTAAVSQCGEPCGVAFDFGVGVASGKSTNQAAEAALMKELTPAQQAAYKSGRDAARQVV